MAKISFKPLGARVLIEAVEQEEITAGGIVLPETAKEKPQQGKVLAAGPGERNDKGERVAMDAFISVLLEKMDIAKNDGDNDFVERITRCLLQTAWHRCPASVPASRPRCCMG